MSKCHAQAAAGYSNCPIYYSLQVKLTRAATSLFIQVDKISNTRIYLFLVYFRNLCHVFQQRAIVQQQTNLKSSLESSLVKLLFIHLFQPCIIRCWVQASCHSCHFYYVIDLACLWMTRILSICPWSTLQQRFIPAVNTTFN